MGNNTLKKKFDTIESDIKAIRSRHRFENNFAYKDDPEPDYIDIEEVCDQLLDDVTHIRKRIESRKTYG